ncbi:MAG: DUF3578 domain-containing protein [Bacteroidales bacterium]|nr:DUF3578 domain-containing protein [Bacteroidales bacterium]
MFYEHVKEFISRSKSISEQNLQVSGNIGRLAAGFPSKYSGLKVKVSFGQGNWARITWIGFLAEGQAIQHGIYPVYLYYRDIDLLILAYGVSATNPPDIQWRINDPQTIGDYFRKNNISASGKYNKSYVYKVYSGNAVDESADNDLDDLIQTYKHFFNRDAYKETLERITSPAQKAPKNTTMNPLITRAIEAINQSGLLYSNQFISRFVISLMTKPFVILSGLAGSGKTQLAIAFAKAMSADVDNQVCIVPVGADWTNREPLLGYPNSLDNKTYVFPESGALQLLLRAAKDKENPYFLILDEMNLSYVERYFADFLSALESHDKIPLWEGKADSLPHKIELPRNLFIIGTINVDETTYMFSPKVLDRASVIEFKISPEEMETFLKKSPHPQISKIQSALKEYATEFVRLSSSDVKSDMSSSKEILIDSFKQLKLVNAEFGYRSASEIGRFIALSKSLAGMTDDEAIDAAIVQKLLPKLHGSRKKLEPVLKALWSMCGTGNELDMNLSADTIPNVTKYKLAADKILRMYKGAVNNSFTSFAEA